MAIPTASNFPNNFDSDENLFLVHDALRVRLAEDYAPGDTSIFIEGDPETIAKFPPSGFITCTEQCSDLPDRAITFWYASRTSSSFDGLIVLPEFDDVPKPKGVTNVTQNVMDRHHNSLKDALIAIQQFVGIEGQTDTKPLGDTISGRINFLRKLILTPRAWFTMDARVGLAPMCVTFTDQSFRLGDGEVIYIWDFGDGPPDPCSTISCEISHSSNIISVISNIPSGHHIVRDLDGGTITKCYTEPGYYTVVLSVVNEFGTDVCKFDDVINVRSEAPDQAVVDFIPKSIQDFTPGSPAGGPYIDSTPKIRSKVNTFIEVEVPSGENPATPGRSYAGELLDGMGVPIDPIVEYTWSLGDDLNHSNQSSTRASYSLGGIYDLELRVDTQFGSYRITAYEDAIDIVEAQNLWLFTFNAQNSQDGGTVQGNEFGLLSETFKLLGNSSLTINRDNSFLDYLSDTNTYYSTAEQKAKSEFSKNVVFTPHGSTASGDEGLSLLFWASGGSVIANQSIQVRTYNAFADAYGSQTSISNRPWNWTALVSDEKAYFVLGTKEDSTPSGTNLALAERVDYTLSSFTAAAPTSLTSSSFENGADELLQHPSSFSGGVPTNGYFATYRTAWKDQTGYILRNSGVNEFFRLADFYKTQGTLSEPFVTLTKLPDITGQTKLEGQLVPMFNGIFFFNNTGEISAWNELSGTWEVGRTSSATLSFRSLQDTSVSNFDSRNNTLLATSDGDRIAYLSYDYSPNAFIKFNGTDQTFVSAGTRPTGKQFTMGIY